MDKTLGEIEKRTRLMDRLTSNLPILRAGIGASQSIVAEKIGISRQTYNSIENGKREMNWTTFVALVAFFRSNEATREMLTKMDEFNSEIEETMELR